MSRSIRTTLVLVAVALAVPATALAMRGHAAANRLSPRTHPVTIPAAATVSGYTGGVLTLVMAAGRGPIAAAVTPETRLDCPRVGTGRGRGFTPPPPCDTSLLVVGEQVAAADLQLTATGAAFRSLVLLPPAPPVVSGS